jgi:type III pantothenate kinase
VRCAYSDPARLGVDRWVAVLAAFHAARGAACVLSAGTAVTFDAVDAAGRHLGGLILAGPRLAADALERHTSNIGATAPAGAAPSGLGLLGKSTDTAVAHGTMLALAAALDRAVRTVDAALGVRSKVYVTGGDGPQLRAWLETEAELRADLVLEGLSLYAAHPAAARAR